LPRSDKTQYWDFFGKLHLKELLEFAVVKTVSVITWWGGRVLHHK
jgi:hypothetical protein